ncbi:MAG TPA: hypothetical protein VKW77_00355 [Acidimicrobiales bacterium]|nr:hypothetical protein [Acidimicrobiales bacterium]
MERVVVLGPGGAGKSAFARRLGQAAGLPVVELDALFWSPDLVPTPQHRWSELQHQLVQGPRGILDGDLGPYDVVGPRLRAADTVIVLDTPRWRCTVRALRRSRQRADFWRWLWGWRRHAWPIVRAAIAADAGGADVLIVRGQRARRRLLADAAATADE